MTAKPPAVHVPCPEESPSAPDVLLSAEGLAFSPERMERFQWLLTRYPTRQAALLPALRLAEEEWGNIHPGHLRYIAGLLELPPAHVWGVYSFYTHYRRPHDGKYVLHVCHTLPCALRGAAEVHDHLARRLEVATGETTPDGLFTLKKAECLGGCDKAPVVCVNEKYHEGLSIEELDRVLDELVQEGRKGGAS